MLLTSRIMIRGLLSSAIAILARLRSPPDNPITNVPPISTTTKTESLRQNSYILAAGVSNLGKYSEIS